jgi:hypothetical protein
MSDNGARINATPVRNLTGKGQVQPGTNDRENMMSNPHVPSTTTYAEVQDKKVTECIQAMILISNPNPQVAFTVTDTEVHDQKATESNPQFITDNVQPMDVVMDSPNVASDEDVFESQLEAIHYDETCSTHSLQCYEDLFSCPIPVGVIHVDEVHWGNIKQKKACQDICHCNPLDSNSSTRCLDGSCILFASQEECNPNCPTGVSCGNIRIQKKQWKRVQVFDTGSEKGLGLRTLETILKGELIIEYVGAAVYKKNLKQLKEKYKESGLSYVMELDKKICIDATKKGGLSRYMNHSCQPNCKLEKWVVNGGTRAVFFANRDIEFGEELTFDYLWLPQHSQASTKCTCRTSICLGTIEIRKNRNEQPDEANHSGNIYQSQITSTVSSETIVGVIRQEQITCTNERQLDNRQWTGEENTDRKCKRQQRKSTINPHMKVDEAALEQTSWTNEMQVEERQEMGEAISNRESKRLKCSFHSLTEFLNLFHEFTEVKDAPKRNSNTTIKADYVFLKCATCGWGVANNDQCSKCKHPLHFDCGFKFKDEEHLLHFVEIVEEEKKG